MTLDHVAIRSYFAPPARSYWRWTEGGTVAGWKDELTIAFREELLAVLTRLAPRGLPPLGSVLLLLAACRDNWEDPPDRRTLLHAHLGLLYGGGYSDLLTEVLTGLGQVYRVRDEVRSASRKAALAAALFDDAPGRHPPEKSAALAERFRLGLAPEEQEWKPESALDDLLRDLGSLRPVLCRFDFDKLELRLQTGLDDAPDAAPVEPPPPATARELIATLQDDPELGAVARLAQLLLAAIHLPRALSDPDELPIGGVSDISNRGSLDRLLLSELAGDDLTLAVRVAMNEALYLRRESPPRTPPRQRRLLLDAGIRTWGVPRVFVTAVGLALAAQADEKIRVQAFHAAGGEARPIDLNSAAGLKSHLAVLDHRLHPAAAAAALARMPQTLERASIGGERNATEGVPYSAEEVESDLVLITTEDTLADAEFQRTLHEAAIDGLYLAAVSRDGRFELIHKLRRGSKTLCRARFDLDEVQRPRPGVKKLIDSSGQHERPAFLKQEQPPLRFSCALDVARSWLVHPKTVVSYSRDGRLLLWDDPNHAARQVACGLNQDGNLLYCDSTWSHDGEVRLVIGRRSKRGLQAVTIPRHAGQWRAIALQLAGEQPRDVIGLSGAVLVIHDDLVEALSWDSGEHLAGRSSLQLPQRQGRFFTVDVTTVGAGGEFGREWRALSFHAGRGDLSIQAELVFREPADAAKEQRQLLRVADVAGCEGPLGLDARGNVIDLAAGRERPPLARGFPRGFRTPLAVVGVSRDGQRFLVRGFHDTPGQPTRVANLLLGITGSGAIFGTTSEGQNVLELPIFELAHPRITHNKFRAIGVSSGGELTLVSRRGQHRPISHVAGQRDLRFPAQPRAAHRQPPLAHVQEFRRALSFTEGYTLDIAQWPGGSTAWLDSRGLLHLRGAGRMLPEVTIVLCDGPMAAWRADGWTCGASYWVGPNAPMHSPAVPDTIVQPFIAQLP